MVIFLGSLGAQMATLPLFDDDDDDDDDVLSCLSVREEHECDTTIRLLDELRKPHSVSTLT